MDIYIAMGDSEKQGYDVTSSCYRIVSEQEIINSEIVRQESGHSYAVNEYMEIQATINALQSVYDAKVVKKIVVHTDSEHIYEAMTIWMSNWPKNGWKNQQGQPLVNADSWKELYRLVSTNMVTWQHYDRNAPADPNEAFVVNRVT